MTLKILSVDDSKTIRMIIKKAFKPYDCDIKEAENGVEGLAVANKYRPDLIILDITMPVMTGVEMLEKLKAEPALRDIPVIMLTAESGKDNVLQIVKMGVKDYMVKPFKGEQLIDRVKKITQLEPKKEEKGKDGDEANFFSLNGDIQTLVIPAKFDDSIAARLGVNLTAKTAEMTKAGINKLILDLSKAPNTSISLIKIISSVTEKCQNAKIYARIVGDGEMAERLKDFTETVSLTVYGTVEEAKASFN
jgi:CheY-like chemotaxis protein